MKKLKPPSVSSILWRELRQQSTVTSTPSQRWRSWEEIYVLALAATTEPGAPRPWKFTPIALARVALWATLIFDALWIALFLSGSTPVEEAPPWTSWQVLSGIIVIFGPPPVVATALLIRIHRQRDLRGALIGAFILAVYGVLAGWIGRSFFTLPAAALAVAVGWRRYRSGPRSRTVDKGRSAEQQSPNESELGS